MGDGYSGLPPSVPTATADTHCSQPPSRSSVAAAAIPTIVERTKAANCMQKRGANGRSHAAHPVGGVYSNLPPSVPLPQWTPTAATPRRSSVAAAAIQMIVERTKAANCMQKRGANGRSHAAQPVGDGYSGLPPSVSLPQPTPTAANPPAGRV